MRSWKFQRNITELRIGGAVGASSPATIVKAAAQQQQQQQPSSRGATTSGPADIRAEDCDTLHRPVLYASGHVNALVCIVVSVLVRRKGDWGNERRAEEGEGAHSLCTLVKSADGEKR